jgi:predicted nucleotidyltransferase
MPLVEPADPTIVAVLRAVDSSANELGREYFLVGATARDLLLVNALGFSPSRATRDIDFGLAVENWEQFTAFKQSLLVSGRFRAKAGAVQRLHYTAPSGALELPVDIIPFGPIASEAGSIAWPPLRDVVMSVAGFDDAARSSIRLRVDEDLVIRIASLPGLTILKLLAWGDRGKQNNKDEADLYTLLSTYADAGNFERLYEDEADLLEGVEFDVVLAGAQMLGRDVARICEAGSLRRIREILDATPGTVDLAYQMNRAYDPFDERPEVGEKLLACFRRGMADIKAVEDA